MVYRLPTLDDYDLLKEYVIEHYSNHEKSISASLGMTNMDFKEWVEKVNRNANKADDEWGRYYLYLVFDNNKLIGLLNIRFELPIDYRNQYGDIGYGVRPSERRKGYATKMLKYALSICKDKGMNEVIVGCYKDNFGSNKTILKNNGMLYRTTTEDLVLSDNWAITLDNNYYKITL